MFKPPFQIEGYTIRVVLPFSYDQSTANYPVVYVQDGGDIVGLCYNQLDHLVRSEQISPCIYVGIEPIDRNDDYTPWPANGLLPGRPSCGGKADRYLDILVNQIKPTINRNYRTKPEPEHTAIAGGSFGALVSLFASYRQPGIFGNYILLSPSVWYEGVLEFIRDGKPSIDRSGQQMFMYVGEIEGIYHQTRQKHMVPYSKEAAAYLQQEGFSQFDFLTQPEGTHDAHYFALYFIEAMKRLFPYKTPQLTK